MTLTFFSTGNWNDITSKRSGTSVSVSEQTQGIPSLTKWRLQLPIDGGKYLVSDVTNSAPTEEQVGTDCWSVTNQ